jgi:hypothetical protein
MKPSVTIDERGVVLHVTDSEGNGVAVPLNAETAAELAEQLANVKAQLAEPSKRWSLLGRISRAVVREVLERPDATPDPDKTRKANR